MLSKLLLSTTTTMLLLGPPRIAVQTTNLTGDAVAVITADYHTDEDDARIYATLYTNDGGERRERTITMNKLDAHRFRITRSLVGTDPGVLVVGVEQGEQGKHGAAEALIRLRRGGVIGGVDIPTERSGNHNLPRRITEREITAALGQVGARAAD